MEVIDKWKGDDSMDVFVYNPTNTMAKDWDRFDSKRAQPQSSSRRKIALKHSCFWQAWEHNLRWQWIQLLYDFAMFGLSGYALSRFHWFGLGLFETRARCGSSAAKICDIHNFLCYINMIHIYIYNYICDWYITCYTTIPTIPTIDSLESTGRWQIFIPWPCWRVVLKQSWNLQRRSRNPRKAPLGCCKGDGSFAFVWKLPKILDEDHQNSI